MKKKIVGTVALAAALTLASGITAFAGTWVSDMNGWKYQLDDGNFQGMGWFTDPETGLEYFIDPDGYMMAGTHVEGYWLDDSGVKHEKSEAQIQAEQNRAARLASRPSPGREAKEATDAAAAAKTTGVAASTRRIVYSNEMLNLYDSIFLEAKKGLLKSEFKDYFGSISKDNLQTTYYYEVQNIGKVLEGTIWKVSNAGKEGYTPYAAEIKYNRNQISYREDSKYLDQAFQSLMMAALGQGEGQRIYDMVMSKAPGEDDSFTLSGTTDTGNTYDLTYRYSTADIKITCSEVVAEEENAEETATEEVQSDFEEEETVASVITAGGAR